MIIKKIFYLLIAFLLSLNINAFALSAGHNGDEILGSFPTNNIYVDYDDSKLYFNGYSKYVVYRQLAASVLKGHGVNPALYVDYGLAGAYAFTKAQNESASFAVAFPSNYDKTVTNSIRIGFSTDSTTGYVAFEISYRYFKEGEDVSTTNAEYISTVTVNACATENGYTYAVIDLAKPDDSDKFILFIFKRLSNTDTVANTVYVTGTSIVYYANKMGG